MRRSLLIRWCALVLVGGVLCVVQAQTASATAPSFEVATVRSAKPDATESNFNYRGSEIHIQNFRLIDLLKDAWELGSASDSQIEGAPDWVANARYDLDAKLDDTTTTMPYAQRQKVVAAMLLQLMRERFHLEYRSEMKPRRVLALVVSKSGSKLQVFAGCDFAVKGAECKNESWQGLHNDGEGHIEARAQPVSVLANILAIQPDTDGRLVVDDTGLTGKYNFELHYSPDAGRGDAGTGPSLFSALQEQLGLKLETKTLPVKVFTITNITSPTGND